jgi:hyperosmotically inducible protein
MKKQHIITLSLALCLSPMVASVFTGCARDDYSRSTGEYIDDKTLALRVGNALGDNREYKLDAVEVRAYRGNVQLSGFVNTADQKKRAGEITKNIEGVKSVENNISVKEKLDSN